MIIQAITLKNGLTKKQLGTTADGVGIEQLLIWLLFLKMIELCPSKILEKD